MTNPTNDTAVEPRTDSAQRPHGWVPVRTLGRQHARRVVAHLLALDPDDRARRFGVAASDDRIRQYVAQIDFEHDRLFGIFDRRLRLVAMAHLAFSAGEGDGDGSRDACADDDTGTDDPGAGGSAEFGVSVLAEQRGQRLASRLFEHAVVHARNRGVGQMVVHTARDNEAMVAIVRRAGAVLRYDGADVVARLPLAADTLGSQIEALIEQHAAAWDYRLKLQTLRM